MTGIKRTIYEFCDEARSSSVLERHIAAADLSANERGSLSNALSELVDLGLLLNEDGKWLSLGVAAEYQIQMLSSLAETGLPAPPRTSEAFTAWIRAVRPQLRRFRFRHSPREATTRRIDLRLIGQTR